MHVDQVACPVEKLQNFHKAAVGPALAGIGIHNEKHFFHNALNLVYAWLNELKRLPGLPVQYSAVGIVADTVAEDDGLTTANVFADLPDGGVGLPVLSGLLNVGRGLLIYTIRDDEMFLAQVETQLLRAVDRENGFGAFVSYFGHISQAVAGACAVHPNIYGIRLSGCHGLHLERKYSRKAEQEYDCFFHVGSF